MSLRARPFDLVLATTFACFFVGSAIADIPVAFGAELSPTSPNPLARMVYGFAAGCDPITLHEPAFIRVIAFLSTLVFVPFYPVLAYALVRRRDWIRTPALAYAAAITATNSVYFGVAFFGEPEWRCQNVAKFLAATLPYAIAPIVLAVRMRKAEPFAASG